MKRPSSFLFVAIGSGVVSCALIAGLPLASSATTAIDEPLRFGVMDDAALAVCLNQHLGQPAPYDQPISADQLASYGAHEIDEHEEAEGGHDHDEAEHGGLAVRCESARGGAKITDLRGIEHLHHIEILNLNGNAISDIRPLAGLTELKELWLMDNRIQDTRGIGALPELRRANLSGNAITVIAPFEPDSPLDTLDLSRNELTDITPISALPSLQVLALHNNHITDLGPLGAAKALSTLYVDANEIMDLSPLGGLDLKILGASQNLLTDLAPLRDRPLEVLYLAENRISDVEPLGSLDRLTLLHLDDNVISDVRPLERLAALSMVTLDRNQISDLSPLKSLADTAMIRAVSQNIVQAPATVRQGGTSFTSNEVPRDTGGAVVSAIEGSAGRIDAEAGTVIWDSIDPDATSLELAFENRDGTFSGTVNRNIARVAFAGPPELPGVVGSAIGEASDTVAVTAEAPQAQQHAVEPAARGLASTGAEASPILTVTAVVLLSLGAALQFFRRRTLRHHRLWAVAEADHLASQG